MCCWALLAHREHHTRIAIHSLSSAAVRYLGRLEDDDCDDDEVGGICGTVCIARCPSPAISSSSSSLSTIYSVRHNEVVRRLLREEW